MCHYYHKKQNVGIGFLLVPRSEALVVPNCQKRATLKPHDYMYTHKICVRYILRGHHRCFAFDNYPKRPNF